jgi:glycosyltransferase involved in cell wall biosynthesis
MDEAGSVERRLPAVILTPDLSANAVGRSLVFIDQLLPHRPVVLAGPRTGPFNVLLADRTFPVIDVGRPGPGAFRAIQRIVAVASVAVSTKPLAVPFLAALRARTGTVVLDVDDPEIALATADVRTLTRAWFSPNSPVITSVGLALRHRAAALTVASPVLEQRYGGRLVRHSRGGPVFPIPVGDRATARARLALDHDRPLAVFAGTPRGHKGVEVLVEAAARAPHVSFVVVGASGHDSENVSYVPRLPYREAMQWLVAADVVLVPQRSSRVSRLQTPAKLSDALSAGRAVVASDLPPIREALGGAGVLIPPDDAVLLAETVVAVVGDRQRREALEAASRRRFAEAFDSRRLGGPLSVWLDTLSRR